MRRLLFPLAALLFACAPPVVDYQPPCDACGVCDDDRTNDCVVDCNGEPGGAAALDECGVCTGGKTGRAACEQDCAGVFGGAARIDDCGECTGGSTGKLPCGVDCADVKGGTAWVDACGECVGGTTEKEPCTADCAGVFGGTASIDECGACTGGDTGLPPCTFDCEGVANGPARTDPCGTCDADPSNDCVVDCAGVPGGNAALDACGTCDTDTANDCPVDCAGVGNGTAHIDNCGACVGGTTGLTPCVQDCLGNWGGEAAVDRCGICAGGESGIEPCGMWCEPFARSLAKTGHAYENDPLYFKENVPTDHSWYGMEDAALSGLSWLEYFGRLSLPPGSWKVQWKVAAGESTRDVRLTVDPGVEAAGCVAHEELIWRSTEQVAGTYGVSPPLTFKVEGEHACAVNLNLLSQPYSVAGYRVDWIRATPMCGTSADCPKVAGTEVSCEERECRYTSKDSDGDGMCDAIDACEGADDRNDLDGDEFPDECDCDPKDRSVQPRRPELCGGDDNNCNGLTSKDELPGVRLASLTDAGRANPEYYVVAPSDESPFKQVLRTKEDLLWWLDVRGGKPVLLNPGRYGVSYRLKTLTRFDNVTLSASSTGPANCLKAGDKIWSAPKSTEWQDTPIIKFDVLSYDCPVTPLIFGGQAPSPIQWEFDSMSIYSLCQVVEDCPRYPDHEAACLEGVCRYESSTRICEP